MLQLLLWCGVVVGPFFICVFLIEGILRAGYQPMRQPVSALSIGPRGWIQQCNFYITGVLAIACAVGLYIYNGSVWVPLLITAYGVGLIGAGMFVTDITGLSTENLIAGQRPRSGVLHDMFSFPVFAGLFAACIIYAVSFYKTDEIGWALYSGASATALLVFFVLAGIGFSGHPIIGRVGGLMQRIAIIAGFMWFSLVAAHIATLV